MRKTLRVSVFVLALCGSAFAGDINDPPLRSGDALGLSGESQSSSTQATDGIIHGDETDSLTTAALALLDTVLALF